MSMPAAIVSIGFEMEWPPKSGEIRTFPEAEEASLDVRSTTRGD